MDDNADDKHFLVKHVSLGDVLVLVSSLIVFAFGYGRLSRDVESLTRAMMELQGRDITPGARSEIAAIRATDAAIQQQVTDLRTELREQRKDIVVRLERIEEQLDRHSERDR